MSKRPGASGHGGREAVTIHYGDDERPDIWRVGASFEVDGDRYALTAKGLRETVRDLVNAGFLAPTHRPGHYQATLPVGAE